jgi:hypothetical protein
MADCKSNSVRKKKWIRPMLTVLWRRVDGANKVLTNCKLLSSGWPESTPGEFKGSCDLLYCWHPQPCYVVSGS